VLITENDLNRLKREYTVAFERYADLAQQTCDFVSDIQKCPISVNERSGLILHRRREDTARDAYLAARHKLMDCLIGTSKIAI
jgi:hypothetical protein